VAETCPRCGAGAAKIRFVERHTVTGGALVHDESHMVAVCPNGHEWRAEGRVFVAQPAAEWGFAAARSAPSSAGTTPAAPTCGVETVTGTCDLPAGHEGEHDDRPLYGPGESDPCACRKAVPGMWTSGYDEKVRSFVRHGAKECEEFVRRAASPPDPGFREGVEAALREVNAIKQRKAVSRDRAAAAGREGVASHRSSDASTCEEIEDRLRALRPGVYGGHPRHIHEPCGVCGRIAMHDEPRPSPLSESPAPTHAPSQRNTEGETP
jgi:hypothetical protein